MSKQQLIKCFDCKKNINKNSINTVLLTKALKTVCDDCITDNYGFCVDCDYFRPIDKMHDNSTDIDGLCEKHFNSQYDGDFELI